MAAILVEKKFVASLKQQQQVHKPTQKNFCCFADPLKNEIYLKQNN